MPDETVNVVFNAIDNASGSLGGIIGKFKDLTTVTGLATAAMALATGAAALLGKSLAAAAEEETGMVRLSGTLRSMGRDSEISAGQISKMANSLMEISTFDDEDIVNAYNALARFSSIPTDSMDSLVKVSMDMTAVLGGDLTSNAESIAKLLESGLIPRTWGWSAALKAQVQELIKGGDSAGAMAIVMGKLNEQFGGQAAAQVDTYAGSVKQATNEWEEFLENYGKPFLGIGKGISGGARELISSLNDMYDVFTMTPEQYQAAHWSFKNLEQDIIALKEAVPLSTEALAELDKELANLAAEETRKNEAGLSDIVSFTSTYQRGVDDVTSATLDLVAAEEEAAEKGKHYSTYGATMVAARQKVIDLAQALNEAKQASTDATNEMIAGFLQAQLTIDGTFTEDDMKKVLQYRLDMGLLTQEAYDAALNALAIATNLANIPAEVHTQVTIDTEHNDTYWTYSGSGSAGGGTGGGGTIPLPLARGGSVSGRYAITGDSMSGRPTGYEELVDFQAKRVYSAPQTRAMGALNAPHNAGGSGEPFGNLEAILKALPRDIMAAVARIIPA